MSYFGLYVQLRRGSVAGYISNNDMAKYKAINEQDRCVACGVCVKVCPKDAISIYKGCYAQIDEEKCIGCGICEKNCPAGVMHKVLRQPV